MAAASLSNGVTVAAALSGGLLQIHMLADASSSSSSGGAEQLTYVLEAEVSLPAAPTSLAAISSLPAASFAVGCGSRHDPSALNVSSVLRM